MRFYSNYTSSVFEEIRVSLRVHFFNLRQSPQMDGRSKHGLQKVENTVTPCNAAFIALTLFILAQVQSKCPDFYCCTRSYTIMNAVIY